MGSAHKAFLLQAMVPEGEEVSMDFLREGQGQAHEGAAAEV